MSCTTEIVGLLSKKKTEIVGCRILHTFGLSKRPVEASANSQVSPGSWGCSEHPYGVSMDHLIRCLTTNYLVYVVSCVALGILDRLDHT